jgi:hypothetical protein
MALIAVAADKGAPGVTTTSIALGAVWPRPVLLAECDPSGGDVLYRLPAADGGRLDSRRGLLSLAVAARRGLQPRQVWEHAQKLHGGLDVLVGVAAAEQGAGLELLWGQVGRVLSAVPQADIIADCGRLGVDGPIYDLLAQASSIVLLSRATLSEVVRLRERVGAVGAALQKRGRARVTIDVVLVADYKDFKTIIADVGHALQQSGVPARIVGGIAYEPKSAEQLRGEWSGRLDKSMFIRTARAIAADLAASLPVLAGDGRQAAGAESGPAGPPDPPPASTRQPPAGSGQAPGGPAGAPVSPAVRQPQPSVAAPRPVRPAPDPQRYPAAPPPGQQPHPAPPGRQPPVVPGNRHPPVGPQPDPVPGDRAQPASPVGPYAPPAGHPASRGRHAGAPAAPAGAQQDRERGEMPQATPRNNQSEPTPDATPPLGR